MKIILEATVNSDKLKPGDVILFGGKQWIVLDKPGHSRRGDSESKAVKFKEKNQYLRGQATKYATLFFMNNKVYPVIGHTPASELLRIKSQVDGIQNDIHTKRKEAVANLHQKLDINWDERRYELTLQNGDVVKAGDLVDVKFSNGHFDMIIGNDRGKVGNFSPNSRRMGQIFVRSPRIAKKARSIPYEIIMKKVDKTA